MSRHHRRLERARPRHRHSRLTPEQRAYRAARRRAHLKLSFITHFVAYASVCMFLLVVSPRAALIVALSWGIGIVFHGFAVLVAPGLRQRLIEREVERELESNISRERRSLEGRHARSLEQLSAAIAHEIRNPITAAKSLVQQMGEDPASGENVSYANVALEELDRVERSISHLLRYAREEELVLGEVRVRDLVDSALETFRERARRTGVALTQEVDGEASLRGDAEKLRRVLINLVGNALDALEEGGTREPSIHVLAGENLAGSEVWLRVRDNGPGVDAETLAMIFSPFYTSKANGTGLGLAISKKLVDAHGGTLELVSEPGGGAEFQVTLPRSAAPREPSA